MYTENFIISMASSRSVVLAALIANGMIAITKFIGYLLTGSPSMLSETYHSVSDTGNQVLLLTGLEYGNTEPTDDHPFGKGKSQFFYSFLVSVFLFGIAGFQSAKHGYSAVKDALSEGSSHGSEASDVIIQGFNITEAVPFDTFWINIVVLLAAFVFELWALYKANKGINRIQEEYGYDGIVETFKKTTDVTTLTAFTEDTVALIGIVLALAGIIATRVLENPLFDAATSLIIGLLLMFVAVALAWENKRLLLGESMTPDDEQMLVKVVEEFDEVESVISMKTTYFGPKKVLVAVRADFKDDLSAKEVEDTIDEIHKQLRDINDDVGTVYVEAEDR
jgi:cation diffusion facilitator family transporter